MPPPRRGSSFDPADRACRTRRVARDARASGAGDRRRARAVGIRALPHRRLAVGSAARSCPRAGASFPPDRELVLVCHHGSRSQHAAQWLARNGFARVHNLRGRRRRVGGRTSTRRCAATDGSSKLRAEAMLPRHHGLRHERTRPSLAGRSSAPCAVPAAPRPARTCCRSTAKRRRATRRSPPRARSGRPRRSACRRRAPALLPSVSRAGAGQHQQLRRDDQHARPKINILANYG